MKTKLYSLALLAGMMMIAPTIAFGQTTAKEWADMGLAYNDQKDYTEAIRCFEKAIELKSDNMDMLYILIGQSYTLMGMTYYGQKDYTEAIRCFDKAINPWFSPSSTFYLFKGNAKHELGEKAAACAAWEKAVELGDETARENLWKYCK